MRYVHLLKIMSILRLIRFISRYSQIRTIVHSHNLLIKDKTYKEESITYIFKTKQA